MPPRKNEVHPLRIEGYGNAGEGVARLDGQAVFVRGAIPGELCAVQLLKVGKTAAWGRVTELLERSEARQVPDCPNYPTCGGCQLRHMSYREELEFMEQGYIRRPKTATKKPSTLPPLEYTTSDGFRVLVGRNNKQNDVLTLKTAKKLDLWFHTKDIAGSHTILVTEGGEVPESSIIEAARIAAYHSKARESSNVPVDYTLVKHVSKPNGAKPGMVIFVNNRTVFVDPALPEKINF